MRKETRVVFNGYLKNQARLNNLSAEDVSTKFTVEPSIQQKLETAIQESSEFLKKINVIGVDEMKGEALLIGVNGPIASRTNTKNKKRAPKYAGSMASNPYECVQTNFDTAFPYAIIDQWAKFKDFQERLAGAISEQQALDRVMIGFNGTSAAVETDYDANPLLEDVNIGWLEKIRTQAPDRVITEGDETPGTGKLTIGAGGDYETLDGLVFDLKQLLDKWHRNRPGLVAVISSDMLHSRFLRSVEKGGDSNQEDLAADQIITRSRIGGLPYVDAPFFPDGTVMITTLSNLSLYYQNGKRRRHVKDEPEQDRIADYQSSNEAYVVEDLGLVALAENIEPVPAPAADGG